MEGESTAALKSFRGESLGEQDEREKVGTKRQTVLAVAG